MPMDIKPPKGASKDGPGNTSQEAMDAEMSANQIQAILAERDALAARLAEYEGAKVVRPQFEGEVPRYRIMSEFFGPNDHLYGEGDEIDFLGIPNTEMLPVNEAAQKRMEAYINDLNECAIQKASIYGRAALPVLDHQGRFDHASHTAQSLADERIAARTGGAVVPLISMPKSRDAVPQMPHTPEALARARMMGAHDTRGELIVSATPAPPKAAVKLAPDRPIQGSTYRGAVVA